jgi:adenosine deaminase
MIELHCHLDGSIRFHTLQQLATRQRKPLPIPREITFHKGMSLQSALKKFELTLSVLQQPQHVTRVANEICEDAEAIGVHHMEIRFAPQLHGGASIERIVDAAIDGLDYDSNLILCGLYGEPPEMLNKLVEVAKPRPRVVGIDLAGGPLPTHKWNIFDYIEPFEKARRYGIGRTVHAAEGRSPKEIEVAINFLHAQRIGHGTTILEDQRVVDLVREKNVVLEACITSNFHTGVIDDISDHPIKKWITQDIPVSICADNTLLSNTDLSVEIMHSMLRCGLTDEDVEKTYDWGRQALFRR